jgi:hypothetical protein
MAVEARVSNHRTRRTLRRAAVTPHRRAAAATRNPAAATTTSSDTVHPHLSLNPGSSQRLPNLANKPAMHDVSKEPRRQRRKGTSEDTLPVRQLKQVEQLHRNDMPSPNTEPPGQLRRHGVHPLSQLPRPNLNVNHLTTKPT